MILIVEDSQVQAESLKLILEQTGYDVIWAKDGREGLEMAQSQRPALIISDILMPVMDGYEMCRKIKDTLELRDIPVILLTQLSEVEEVISGLDSRAENYFTKPYDADYLLSKVKSLLNNDGQFRNHPKKRCVEFDYNGRHYEIRSSRSQTLSLLLSTYENAVRQNKELSRVRDELRTLNGQLEKGVMERTSALNEEIQKRKEDEKKLMEQLDELTRFHKATIGRELRMHEIKEENEKLKKRIDEMERKYK